MLSLLLIFFFIFFFFSSRRRHTRSVSAFLLNRSSDLARYGFRCCHLKNIWTAPLPPETELSRQMTTATCDDKSAQIYARFDKNDWRIQPAEFYRFHDAEVNTFGYF